MPPTASVVVNLEGTVAKLTVEQEDSRDQFWVRVRESDGEADAAFNYLDEDAESTAVALAQLQLLRDAMAKGWQVHIRAQVHDSAKRIVRVSVST